MKKTSSEKYLLSWVEKYVLVLTKQTPKTLQEEERKAAMHQGIKETKDFCGWTLHAVDLVEAVNIGKEQIS